MLARTEWLTEQMEANATRRRGGLRGLLRNPEARERLAEQRRETVVWLVDFISKNVARLGATLTMPAETLARVILAVNDGITLGSHLDGEDLYHPYLELVVSSIRGATAERD